MVDRGVVGKLRILFLFPFSITFVFCFYALGKAIHGEKIKDPLPLLSPFSITFVDLFIQIHPERGGVFLWARLRLQQGAQLQPPPLLVPRHQPLLAPSHMHQRQPRLRRVLRHVQGVQGSVQQSPRVSHLNLDFSLSICPQLLNT